MKIHVQHPWNLSADEALILQNRLRHRVELTDARSPDQIRMIAAADISFSRGSSRLFGAVLLFSFPALQLLATHCDEAQIDFPYMPGFLSFREVPVLVNIFRRLPDSVDVILCDGQGIAHPRRFGLAAHLGVVLDVPTIGCAKSRLIGTYREPASVKGAWSDLWDGPERIGVVLRTREGVKPVFVSPGHKMTIDTAREIVMRCVTRYRIPEPLRLAHQAVNRFREHQER
ncbi:MAG: deoxyribonuclease V [Calditrichaeota bacterium]|nr:MAG: deoxyribonuclease V [Calditrichota bacterium]